MAYYQLEIVANLQRIHVFVNKSSNSEMKMQKAYLLFWEIPDCLDTHV